MEAWERIIENDNRQGVLNGTDKDGQDAPLLRYRPVGTAKKLTVAQRLGQRPNLRRGKYAGTGPFVGIVANNNLTSKEYRKLDGPRLAPRRQFSRVITNLMPGSFRDATDRNVWHCVMAWRNVLTSKGKKFLHYHFEGQGNNPRYDLRGVRPSGIRDCKAALVAWAKDAVRRLWRKAA